jgi:hypothetical protein
MDEFSGIFESALAGEVFIVGSFLFIALYSLSAIVCQAWKHGRVGSITDGVFDDTETVPVFKDK